MNLLFFRLPQDVYQVAKVSKILQILEKGNASQFKNMSLDEINLDMETLETELNEDQETDIDKTINDSGTNESSYDLSEEKGRKNVEISYNREILEKELYEEESLLKNKGDFFKDH